MARSIPPLACKEQVSSSLETSFLTIAIAIIVIIICVKWFFFLRKLLESKSHSSDQPVATIESYIQENHLCHMMKKTVTMFSRSQLNSATNNLRHKLGEGAHGTVFKGTLEDGVPVAVKILKGYFSDDQIQSLFKAEFNSIRITHHPNLVKLYGICYDKGLLALVYEFLENGSLDGFLFEPEKRKRIRWQTLFNIAIGTAKGIACLHDECRDRIIHYDVKPQNILLDARFRPKVADFGLAALYSRDATNVKISSFRGTLGYVAPEMLRLFPISPKCDVYSYGILLFEILGRRRYFDSEVPNSQSNLAKYVWTKMSENSMDEMVRVLGIDGRDRETAKRMAMVALRCVQHEPDDRPTMSEVVEMLEGRVMVCCPPFPFPQNDDNSTVNSQFWPSNSNSVWVTAPPTFQ